MAENLLKYAFPRDGEVDVSEIIDKIRSYSSSADEDNELKLFITQLEDIQEKVLDKEDEFYDKLGVKDYSELKGRINEFTNNYDFLLAGGSLIKKVKELYDFSQISHATDEEVMDAVQSELDNFVQKIGVKNIQKNIIEIEEGKFRGTHKVAFAKFIQQHLRLIDTDSTSRRFITSRKGEMVGLGKLIARYSPKTGKITLDTENFDLSSSFRNKLENTLQGLVDKKSTAVNVYNIDPKQFRKDIENLILDNCSGETKQVLTRVISQTNQFDLNRSVASVTGYFGEIRATALMLQITGDLTTRGTGALRTQLKNVEIPIDLVCMANGFQVKNYTLFDNTVTFSNTISSLGWLDNRLKLKGSLRDILIDLFGIYQYNQPFSSTGEKAVRYNQEKVNIYQTEYYDELYNEQDGGLFYKFKEIFDSRVPTMLKIYDTFSVEGDGLFGSEDVYFNTFFWINNKLVPSSYILDNLIRQLQKHKGKIIKTEYTIYQPNRKYSLQKEPNYAEVKTMEFAAKKLKVGYEIEIDLSKFK